MKKIVISGATGFIGSHLCYKFLEMGYQVIGIGRKENERIKIINNSNFKFMSMDNIDIEIIKNADIFYHIAWNMSLANTKDNEKAIELELSNLKMTCEVMDFAIKANVKKIVFCGSVAQEKCYYDVKNNKSITNIKGGLYGIFKHAASEICRKLAYDANIEYNHALLTHTYGPTDLKTICFFIKTIARNEDLNLIQEDDMVDWNYIDDTVDGLIVIGEKGKNMKTYYLGHRKINTFGENIKNIKLFLQSKSNLNFGKFSETKGIDYSKIDLDALYNDTGFECKCDFKESVLKTVEWLKEEGYLNE